MIRLIQWIIHEIIHFVFDTIVNIIWVNEWCVTYNMICIVHTIKSIIFNASWVEYNDICVFYWNIDLKTQYAFITHYASCNECLKLMFKNEFHSLIQIHNAFKKSIMHWENALCVYETHFAFTKKICIYEMYFAFN